MQLEIFLHFQQPGLNLFSPHVLTIEIWWIYFPEFTLQDVYLMPYSLPPNKRHTWDVSWSSTCMSYSSGLPWRMMDLSHASWLPIISMIIPFVVRSRCWYLSSTNCLLGARFFVNFPMQHIHNMKYLFLIFHNPFIIFPKALYFSMHYFHIYRFLPVSSSIRFCLNISHAEIKMFDLLLMDIRSPGNFHNCIPHIRTKLCKKCACNNYC